jgi:malate synthase
MSNNGTINLEIVGKVDKEYSNILNPEALKFIEALHNQFTMKIEELLQNRKYRQNKINAGNFPEFLEQTKEIRESDWVVDPLPDDILDRRVEITGPVDRKMIINALNSGANVFMADFEDSNSPTWENNVEGQINLFEAVRRSITFTNEDGKLYQLNDEVAILMVRPRGIHLSEKNIRINNENAKGCLVDFGLYFYHNAQYLLDSGSGPYFYIPKLENHLEARLWNEIFEFSENYLSIPSGSIKATVLLEHILAAFEMDEILYELRKYSAGLNCGRWDYIFSFIKVFSEFKEYILPDRDEVTMTTHFMEFYVKLLIKTCHRRRTFAMGGMAAQIPIKDNLDLNNQAIEKVRLDKLREVKAGHDGTWVAHPGLIEIAKNVFDEHLKEKNQIHFIPEYNVIAADLLQIPKGTITENGVRKNISIAIQYMAAWLKGSGSVALYNLMEDLATAEISRSQLWQWLHNDIELDNGEKFTKELFHSLLQEEMEKIKSNPNFDNEKLTIAEKLIREFTLRDKIDDFMSISAYNYL